MSRRSKQQATQEGQERLHRAIDTQNDWKATCSECGMRLMGTLEYLLEHKHEEVVEAG
jgi:hypothetical protein